MESTQRPFANAKVPVLVEASPWVAFGPSNLGKRGEPSACVCPIEGTFNELISAMPIKTYTLHKVLE